MIKVETKDQLLLLGQTESLCRANDPKVAPFHECGSEKKKQNATFGENSKLTSAVE